MSTRQERRERLVSRGFQIGFVLAVVVIWYLATAYGGISQVLLPNPVAVARSLQQVLLSGEFWPDLEVTLFEVAVAFAISCGSGLLIGYLISRSKYVTALLEPLLASLYSIPMILFLPLYVLFFGLGPWSKIALGATISFFPIVLNTITGFGTVDRIFIKSARSMGASNAQMFRYVLLPAALPVVLSGLRIGFTVTLLAVLGSETIASFGGLGHHIAQLADAMEPARMFAYIAFAVLIVAALNAVMSSAERRGQRR